MALVNSITELVGNTPLLRLGRLAEGLNATILVKLESLNPAASVKDRIALAMIREAENDGRLKPGGTIVEATSGNTGIGLAMVGASRGYRVIIIMPDSNSLERRRLLQAFGAELILTAGSGGMPAAKQRAAEVTASLPGAVLIGQFENPANPATHYQTTAEEIWRDTAGKIDLFVAGVGSGGTITGVGRRLKELQPGLRVVALEPDSSPVLSGGRPGTNRIQGIGAGFVPQVLDTSVYDEIIRVPAAEAGSCARQLARQEGVLAGISSGANVWAALQLARRPENQGKTIVTLVCDSGERYLSTWLWED